MEFLAEQLQEYKIRIKYKISELDSAPKISAWSAINCNNKRHMSN